MDFWIWLWMGLCVCSKCQIVEACARLGFWSIDVHANFSFFSLRGKSSLIIAHFSFQHTTERTRYEDFSFCELVLGRIVFKMRWDWDTHTHTQMARLVDYWRGYCTPWYFIHPTTTTYLHIKKSPSRPSPWRKIIRSSVSVWMFESKEQEIS